MRLVHQQHQVRQAGEIVEIAFADGLAQGADTALVLVDLVDVEDVDDRFAAEQVGPAHAPPFLPCVAGDDDRRRLSELRDAAKHIFG